MTDGQELYNLLRGYTGCERPYRHSLVKSFLYTDGVREFARNAGGGAYWLLDILATEPTVRKLVAQEGFALVRLTVNASKSALLTVVSDDGTPPVLVRNITYTDCPMCPREDEGFNWKFYIEACNVDDSGNVTETMMMLPQER